MALHYSFRNTNKSEKSTNINFFNEAYYEMADYLHPVNDKLRILLIKGEKLFSEEKFKKGEKLFKKIIRQRHKAKNKEKKIVVDAYNNLGLLYFTQGLIEKSLKFYNKAENFLATYSPDNLNKNYVITANKNIVIIENREEILKAENKEEILEFLYQTLKHQVQLIKVDKKLLLRPSYLELYYNVLYSSFFIFFKSSKNEYCKFILDNIIQNFNMLAELTICNKHAYDIFKMIYYFASFYHCVAPEENDIKDYLIFWINNFEGFDYKDSQQRYQDCFFMLVENLKYSDNYEKFQEYSSLFLEKYQNSHEDNTTYQIIEVYKLNVLKSLDYEKFQLGLSNIKKFRQITRKYKYEIDKETEVYFELLEAICHFGLGRFSKTDQLIDKAKLSNNFTISFFYDALKFLRILAVKNELFDKAIQYCKENIDHLEKYSELDEQNSFLAEELWECGQLCKKAGKNEEAKKAFQKCIDLFLNSEDSEIKSIVSSRFKKEGHHLETEI